MSNTTHTPGPWELVGTRISTVAPDKYRITIATINCAAFGDTTPDARLIAAAPDLLAALRYFAAVPCEHRGNIHCTMIPAGADRKICGPCAARAAIAKAVGT